GVDWLVQGRRDVLLVRLVRLPRAVLGQEVAERLGNAPDLDADLLPVERHGLHHVRSIERVGHDQRIHPNLEASGVAGFGQELLGALGIVGRNFPVLAEALVERVVPVHEGRFRAHALPERTDDRLLVDGEVQGQPYLARVLLALGVLGIARPRAGRAIVLAVRGRLTLQDDPVAGGIRRLVDPEPRLAGLVEVVTEDVADVDLAGAEPGQARGRI